jgi:hypothetical protein
MQVLRLPLLRDGPNETGAVESCGLPPLRQEKGARMGHGAILAGQPVFNAVVTRGRES